MKDVIYGCSGHAYEYYLMSLNKKSVNFKNSLRLDKKGKKINVVL